MAQQPPGVMDALANMASQPSTHMAFTFDKDMLQAAQGYMDEPGQRAFGGLNGITVETYKYREPAFYVPEAMHALVMAYEAAGWKHLVNQNAGPRESAMPHGALTDLWLHFRGTEIDDVTVLVRAPREMSVIEVSGAMRPLDFLHLSGHFGIPKVDPGAVMVPAPPGR
jgi:hypothetical protein